MAIRMLQPFKRKSGVYHLNARVPVDLLSKVANSKIILPLGDAMVAVKASDKVMLSLRTKERRRAVDLCAKAYAALLALDVLQ